MTDPTALPDQTATHHNVRVSVLTDRLVRIEYADDAAFEDRPTLDVVNRRFEPARFTARTEGMALVVDTGAVRVTCADCTRPFTSRSLSAVIATRDGTVTWRHGKRDRGNLGGTVRTLDGWKGNTTPRFVDFDPATGVVNAWDEQPLEPGLVSHDGWVVVDDSAGVLVESRPGRSAAARPRAVPRATGERRDLYLFGYGTDHKAALSAGAQLFGPQPLPPRYAFGYWYSRYYPYTDRDLLELTDAFDRYDVPVDVLVIDMDWHRLGWTGYSWDRDLFPDPDETLAALGDHGLRVALNLHPADGVGAHEDQFAAMCAALRLDPATTDRIPFAITDPAFVDAYFRLLHHPEEDRGVDVWWMDWQQGSDTPVPGLDPLAWLNLLHWDDQARRRPRRRPIFLSRWGGLGAGRYPLGFSGDTYATWESLAYQPAFTATAANVGYGYWSHDIGGHFQSEPDAELYTRWIQFGAYSPVLRTHGSLDAFLERRVWEYPNPFRDVMTSTLRERYEIVPYLYTEARKGVDTGLSIVRPMYHEYPDAAAAYEASGQYHFGDAMVVAPVTSPNEDDAMAPVRVWLPRGEWYDLAHGARADADAGRAGDDDSNGRSGNNRRDRDGRWFERRYLLDEIPRFVPAGTVLPSQQGVRRLDGPSFPNLTVTAFAGADGHYEQYEDDGISTGYEVGRSVWTGLDHRVRAGERRVTIGPAEGAYRGWLRRRPVEVRFVGEAPPRAVHVGEREVPWSTHRRDGHWWFDAAAATVVVSLPRVDLRAATTVTLDRAGRSTRVAGESALDGLPGLARRIDRISDAARALVGDDNRRLIHLAQTAERIARDPSTLVDEVAELRAGLGGLDDLLATAFDHHTELQSLNPLDPPRATDALAAARRLLATTVDQFGS